MPTKLHGHLDALDQQRSFLTKNSLPTGIRRYIAQKANVGIGDVLGLEYYGLNGCDPEIANKIFEALGEARGSLVDHSEKFRLLSKNDSDTALDNRLASYKREREIRCY